MIKKGSGRATTYQIHKKCYQAQLTWGTDAGEYYVVVDNTSAPDGGARPTKDVDVSVGFWKRGHELGQPANGKGLLIGRVALDFAGYKDRFERHSGRLSVCIAQASAKKTEKVTKTHKVHADSNGYFAIGNLPAQDHYWVTGIEGNGFTAEIPFRISGPIGNGKEDSLNVDDLGTIVLTVTKSGSIGCQLLGANVSVTHDAGEKSSQFHFGATTPLDRHQWFETDYAASQWSRYVVKDRKRLEAERFKQLLDKAVAEEIKRKEKSAKAAPAPPSEKSPVKNDKAPKPPVEELPKGKERVAQK
jgi:hypothetical protein